MSEDEERYSRQMRFAPIGEQGQDRLLRSRVTICGCGALGTVLADALCRAGVGFLRLVDRDFVELNNLQRQVLFDEQDWKSGLPKAEAAARKLRRINSQVAVEPVVADLDHRNIRDLCGDADLVLDGTDNFETRFLINDFAVSSSKPWVYGGCIGSQGQSMTIIPGETACLRCLIANAPPPGTAATCETAGILGPVVNVIASVEAAEAIKILSGNRSAVSTDLLVVDLWENRTRRISLRSLHEKSDCPCCKRGEYEWLEGKASSQTARLCGRNAVQVVPSEPHAVDFDQLVQNFPPAAVLVRNQYLVRLAVEDYEVSVFADGRAIIKGTDDLAAARTIYSRYLGG